MKLCLNALQDKTSWLQAGFTLPAFDVEKTAAKTKAAPTWLHLGAGNIFRAFPAADLQKLLDEGSWDTGVIVAECFDGEIIHKAYTPFDSLSVLCVLKSDGSVDKKVIASVCEALRCDGKSEQDDRRLMDVLSAPSLQMVSLTITEKGYAVKNARGEIFPFIQADLDNGPEKAASTMGKLAAGLYKRFLAGEFPLSLVSMDNCSGNGDKLKAAVLCLAEGWVEKGLAEDTFLSYLKDEQKVAFPISMIDKITPRPDAKVAKMLLDCGFEDVDTIITEKNTYTAAFVNAEETEYLVVEDKFPAGRPPLEKAGIYFTDRETVDKTEKMKVCTCLNPLHTALAILGCLLRHETICNEMGDQDLNRLVHHLAYVEAMPVVVNPGILSPEKFAGEVLEKRLPNPFMPDTPQRIATDTSQKLPIRFGETMKMYLQREDLSLSSLQGIPFVLAAWLRYLMAIDDTLTPFTPSPDPLLSQMQEALSFLKIGKTVEKEQLKAVLSRSDIFGLNVYETPLADTVTHWLNRMLEGEGAVRRALQAMLA